jgi:serine/threonine protein kinase
VPGETDKDDSGFIEDPDVRGASADRPEGKNLPAEPESDESEAGGKPNRSESERVITNLLGKDTVIGRCRIDRRIGRGGIGVVYLAHHLTLDSPVAVKVLRPDVMDQPGNFAERFMQEARLAARIRHPNVMSVMDADRDEKTGLYYIVLEFIDGGTVRDLLRKGPVPVEQALDIVSAVTEALEEAAKHGVIHRDIKPDNIMLTASGRVKLADLGLGKELEGDALSITERESVFGTPAYMAPEQAEDSRRADIRSDIYSLGATLAHVLTGHRPFEGQSTYNILKRLGSERIPDPRTLRPEIPEAVAALCLKMTARSILERYQTPTALLKDIRKIRANPDLPASEILVTRPGQQADSEFVLEESPQPTRPSSPLESSGDLKPPPAAYGSGAPELEEEDEDALLAKLEARMGKKKAAAAGSAAEPPAKSTAGRGKGRRGGGTTRVRKKASAKAAPAKAARAAPPTPPPPDDEEDLEFFRDIRQKEPYFLRLWRSLWYPMQALGILFFFVIGVPIVLTLIWWGTSESLQLIAKADPELQAYFTAAVVALAMFLIVLMAAFYSSFLVSVIRVGDGTTIPIIQGMDHHIHIAALTVWLGAFFGPALAVGFWVAERQEAFFLFTPGTIALFLLGGLLAPLALIRTATISPMAGIDLPRLFRDLVRVPLGYLYLLGFLFSVSGAFICVGIWIHRQAAFPAVSSPELVMQFGLRSLGNLVLLFPTAILARALGIFLKYHERWLPYLYRTYHASGGFNRLTPQLITLGLLALFFLPLYREAGVWVEHNRIGIQVSEHMQGIYNAFLDSKNVRSFPRSYRDLRNKAGKRLRSPLNDKLEEPYGFFPLQDRESAHGFYMVWLYEKEPSDPQKRYRLALRRDGRVVKLDEKTLLQILALQEEYYEMSGRTRMDTERREEILARIKNLQTLF